MNQNRRLYVVPSDVAHQISQMRIHKASIKRLTALPFNFTNPTSLFIIHDAYKYYVDTLTVSREYKEFVIATSLWLLRFYYTVLKQ